MPTESLQHLDLHGPEVAMPKHERLKNHLLTELATGRLKPGQPLPSEMQLAKVLRVARSTVRQALSSLEDDGVVRRERGRGTFIDGQAHHRLRRGIDAFAMVVPDTRRGYYPSLLHSFEAVSKEVHNQAFVCNTENDADKQAGVILQLIDKKVAGVAIVPTDEPATPPYQIRQLQQQGIPVVFCHRRVDGIQAPLVTFPYRQVGSMAGEAFVRHGHRRVAMFATFRAKAALAYEAGLREAMQAGGGDLPDECIYFGSLPSPNVALQEEEMLEALKRICLGPNTPTAIMVSFDPLAELIYMLLGRLGLRMPEDISLVGFGGTWREGAITRQLTSVTVDEAELGRHAVKMLHEMRSGDRPIDDNEEIVMPLGLSDGQTLGHKAATGGDCPDFRAAKMGLSPSTPKQQDK